MVHNSLFVITRRETGFDRNILMPVTFVPLIEGNNNVKNNHQRQICQGIFNRRVDEQCRVVHRMWPKS